MAAKVNLPVRGVIENMSWFTGDDGKRYELFGAGGGAELAAELDVPLLAQLPLVPGAARRRRRGPADRRRRPRQRDRPGVPRARRADRRRAAAEEGVQPRAEGRLSSDVEPVPRYRFERLVADALDDLPDELAAVLDNVVVQVEDRNPDEPDLLGLYEGVPHTERTGQEGPDVVSIYRLRAVRAVRRRGRPRRGGLRHRDPRARPRRRHRRRPPPRARLGVTPKHSAAQYGRYQVSRSAVCGGKRVSYSSASPAG